jgi:predicted nuclease of predicted toxin-antitoxin system
MSLLFDQNLSFKLCQTVADVFPGSVHVRTLGLSEVGDQAIWDYAKANGLTIVSQDVDFAEKATLFGAPPKVIWLRAGNQSTAVLSLLLRRHAEAITRFASDDNAACLEIY